MNENVINLSVTRSSSNDILVLVLSTDGVLSLADITSTLTSYCETLKNDPEVIGTEK